MKHQWWQKYSDPLLKYYLQLYYWIIITDACMGSLIWMMHHIL